MRSEWHEKMLQQLAHIQILPLDEMRKLPEAQEFDSGVYFLWQGEELLYVGKSRNLSDRMTRQARVNRMIAFQTSRSAKYIPSDRHTCLVVESDPVCSPMLDYTLRDLERAYIAFYEPPYNYDGQNGGT